MLPAPPIVLAAGNSDGWELIIWLVLGFIAFVSQLRSSRKKRTQSQAGPARRSETEELSDIFKRLGVSIPGTPPPPRSRAPQPPPHRRATSLPRPTPAPMMRKPKPPESPAASALCKHLAAQEKAARRAALAMNLIQAGDGVSARHDDDRSVSGATRLSQVILPRIHAFDLRLTPFPVIPMPGFERKTRTGPAPRAPLHTHQEIRAAIRAQNLLRAPKSIAP